MHMGMGKDESMGDILLFKDARMKDNRFNRLLKIDFNICDFEMNCRVKNLYL